MATPETMWSTPKVTVAMAWRSPPAAPPAIPMATPHQGPYCQAPQAPNQVPEDHHPLEADVDDAGALGPQPAEGGEADGHGEAQRRPNVPTEVRSGVSVIDRTTDRSTNSPTADQPASRRRLAAPAGWRPASWSARLTESWPAIEGRPSTRLMSGPLRARRSRRGPGRCRPRRPSAAVGTRSPAGPARRRSTTERTMTPSMITTISLGMSSRSRIWALRSRKASSRAPIGDADRVVAAQQGHGDPGEAEPGRRSRSP